MVDRIDPWRGTLEKMPEGAAPERPPGAEAREAVAIEREIDRLNAKVTLLIGVVAISGLAVVALAVATVISAIAGR